MDLPNMTSIQESLPIPPEVTSPQTSSLVGEPRWQPPSIGSRTFAAHRVPDLGVSVQQDVPGFSYLSLSIREIDALNFTHGGMVTLFHKNTVEALIRRINLSPEVLFIYYISLHDAVNSIWAKSNAEENPRRSYSLLASLYLEETVIKSTFDQLVELVRTVGVDCTNPMQKAVKLLNGSGHPDTEPISRILRPNQYLRPAFMQVMNIIMEQMESTGEIPLLAQDYVLLGGVEKKNPHAGYMCANFGIFGGGIKGKDKMNPLSCAFRETEEELRIEKITPEERRKIMGEQDKLRTSLGVANLPHEMVSRGQFGRKTEAMTEAMKAHIIIFPRDFSPELDRRDRWGGGGVGGGERQRDTLPTTCGPTPGGATPAP